MSLLNEIQKDALSPNTKVADLLRKCKVLSRRLKSLELEKWVDDELYGYPPDCESVPNYRQIERATIKGNFRGPLGNMAKNFDIDPNHIKQMFPEGWQKLIAPIVIRDGISGLEVSTVFNADTKPEGITITWPVDLVLKMSNGNYVDGQCLSIWYEISPDKVVNLVDSVKTKVLEFAMDIEAENPDAGEAGFNETPIPPKTVSNIFHNTIHGGVGNMAQGSDDFEQNAIVAPVAQQLNIADWEKLAQELPVLRGRLLANASEEADYEAISGVVAAEKAIDTKDESKLIAGLKKSGQVALEMAKSIGTDVTAAVIVKALGITP